MKKEAEVHADEDKKRRELVDLRNQAESVTLHVEKELQEHGGKVGPQERADIENALNRVKELAKGEDKDALQKGLDDLNKARMKLGEAMYKAQADASRRRRSRPRRTPGQSGAAMPPAPSQPAVARKARTM